MTARVIVTCEHGGKHIPAGYRKLFAGEERLLASHRGYDPGALSLARKIAKALKAPCHFSRTSRLLIELNRSLHHPQLFSRITRTLSAQEKSELIDTVYRPYRTAVFDEIKAATLTAPVIHLSIHSFTPELNGRVRKTDVGLLFDPHRPRERAFCQSWKLILQRELLEHRIHFNRPYRGTSDGFTTFLREQFPDHLYAGIELEVNQKFAEDESAWQELQKRIVHSVRQAIGS